MTKLTSHVCLYNGPVTRATSAESQPDVFTKLTDTRLYTGAHKHRFDDQGHGRGINGRVDQDEFTKSPSQVVDRSRHSLSSSSPSAQRKSGSKPGSPDVFARLTDPKSFRGTHQHRFDADGKGRGMAGRVDAPKSFEFVRRDTFTD